MAERLLDGRSILILEDEYLIAMDVEQTCLDSGALYAVIVGSVDRLSESLLDEGFDAAVLDLRLGGHSTLDFARLLRARDIPFVFATGYADARELEAEFPGVRLVGKPYAADDLIVALTEAIKGRESARSASRSGEDA